VRRIEWISAGLFVVWAIVAAVMALGAAAGNERPDDADAYGRAYVLALTGVGLAVVLLCAVSVQARWVPLGAWLAHLALLVWAAVEFPGRIAPDVVLLLIAGEACGAVAVIAGWRDRRRSGAVLVDDPG
jgi:hypothetical protein